MALHLYIESSILKSSIHQWLVPTACACKEIAIKSDANKLPKTETHTSRCASILARLYLTRNRTEAKRQKPSQPLGETRCLCCLLRRLICVNLTTRSFEFLWVNVWQSRSAAIWQEPGETNCPANLSGCFSRCPASWLWKSVPRRFDEASMCSDVGGCCCSLGCFGGPDSWEAIRLFSASKAARNESNSTRTARSLENEKRKRSISDLNITYSNRSQHIGGFTATS